MGIKHTTVSNIADGPNTTKIRPTAWNADHTIDGDVDFNGHDITNCGNLGSSGGEFINLSDVPNSYAGAGGKVVAVTGGETGLEFVVGGAASSVLDWVTPMQFGAVADGTNHPLSEFYGSLAEAQAAYDGAFFFITSLTQQMDYAAIKAASNECFGPDTVAPAGDGFITPGDFLVCGTGTTALDDFSFNINDGEPDLIVDELAGQTAFVAYFSAPGFVATSPIVSNTTRKVTCATSIALSDNSMYAFGRGEHGESSQLNKTLYMPAGTYNLGSDTWLIRNLRSGAILGAGKLATVLQGSGDAVLQFDGIWYSRISDMSINQLSSANTAALDIDGNVPGHPYGTRGVQGCTLSNLSIDGGESTYAFAMTRQGGSSGQGSEMLYLNLHLYRGAFSCYYQSGFNALANSFIGGNFQNYGKHGAYIVGGTFAFFNTGFQSTRYYEQYTKSGYDIRCGDSGAFESCPIYGCRTEGPRFLFNANAVNCDVRACVGQPAVQVWFASTSYNTAVSGREWIRVTTGDGEPSMMVATIAGASGGGSEPVWPDYGSGGTVVDGTVTWTEVGSVFIENRNGSIDYRTCYGPGVNKGSARGDSRTVSAATAVALRRFSSTTDYLDVDASGGAVTVYLPHDDNGQGGRTCTVMRRDNTANAITVTNVIGSPEPGNTNIVFPAGQYGYKTYARATDSVSADRWMVVNTKFLEDMIAGSRTVIGGLTVTHYITVSDGAGGTVKLAVVS